MISLTALVLTRDEETNIERTLRAIQWINKVVIIDSFSSDRTVELAQKVHPTVEIVQREFDTHATQWNFGLDQVTTEWVLTLDADHEVSSELATEIQRLNPSSTTTGYEADFDYRIGGRALRASVYPSRTVLFRTKQSSYFDDGHTQRLRSRGTIEKLHGKIYHDDRKWFSQWLEAQRKYARLEAEHLRTTAFGELSVPDRLRRGIFFAPPAMFLYLLFGRGLILDGWPGWVYVFQRTLAEMLLSKELLIGRGRR
jgi:glycosyltransferase involved in cell wall biosynthesis